MEESLRLLVLEDDPFDAELELAAIHTGGIRCETRRVDSRDAFVQALDEGGWDMVLADYNLPGFTGLEALQLLRARDPSLPFILISGTLGEERAVESLKAGANDYVLKDHLTRLAPSIRRARDEHHARLTHRATQERLRQLSWRFLATIEAERRALSRELHDEIGQILTGIRFNLEALSRQIAEPAAQARIRECIDSAQLVLQQVRNVSHNLRPVQLDDLGLVAALRLHLDRQAALGGFRPHFKAVELAARLAPEVETTCFRLAQEALTNVLRHAAAKNVWIDLAVDGDTLVLRVTDDGSGFDPYRESLRNGASSLGLLGMEERVALLNGTVDISSRPGHGVEILARIPVREPAPAET